MKEKLPFNIIELIVAIVLLGVLALSVIYAIDPEERAKADRDEYYRESAKELVEAISKYAIKGETPPIPDNLPWTKISDQIALIDRLVSGEFLGSVFKNNLFFKSGNPQDWLVIGRGQDQQLVWACYIPGSRAGRVDHIPLRRLNLGEPVPEGREPEYCPGPPDWENTFCWTCVSQKLEVK